MRLRKIGCRALLFSAVVFCFLPLLAADAQDVDVPGNLTMHDSTDSTVGNVFKDGAPFLHNQPADDRKLPHFSFLRTGSGL
jgi:hypothetical protein